MRQSTMAEAGFQRYRKRTRRERFLQEMERVVPWKAPQAREFIQEKGGRHGPLSAAQKARNRTRSKVRSKVEHPFQIMKRVFGFTRVRYRGLAKNTHRVHVTCALVNLFLMRKR